LRRTRATGVAALAAGCWLLEAQRTLKEGDLRVTTAFKRLLRLLRTSVIDVEFGAEG
jgi:hypothetical protein